MKHPNPEEKRVRFFPTTVCPTKYAHGYESSTTCKPSNKTGQTATVKHWQTLENAINTKIDTTP